MSATILPFPTRPGTEPPPTRRTLAQVARRLVAVLLTAVVVVGVIAFLALGVGPRVFGYRTSGASDSVQRVLHSPVLDDAIMWVMLGLGLVASLGLLWRSPPERVRTAPRLPAPSPEPDPALDEDTLERLGEDVGEPAFVETFVGLFRAMLDPRLRRLCDALEAEDTEGALDAVLSLRGSASTVGAHELQAAAGSIEACIRRGDLTAARLESGHLVAVALRADAALASYAMRGQNVVQLASRIR